MTLRAIYDFELALLDPCIAMSTRGIRIDEPRRVAMLADLAQAAEPLAAELGTLVTQHILVEQATRLAPDKAHLFRERRVCACCRNGKAKRTACWKCAGFIAKPTKKQLQLIAVDDQALWCDATVERVPDKPAIAVLPVCRICDGVGAFESLVFNPGSPEQVKIVLYDLLKLPARTKDNKLTTDEEALKSLLPEAAARPHATALIRGILKLGKMETTRATLVRIAPGPDGRIRSVYNPAGTETGRFASAATFLVPSTNLNNMQKREATEARFDVRACFIPDDGCVFVEADLSGAEQWVTSACAGDTAFLDILRSGTKVHRWTAARALGKPESAVTEQEYSLYKTARHALNYGMQWNTFLKNVNAVADRTGVAITARQAKETYAGYHALHPKLQKVWWLDVQGRLVRDGTLTTCFGRKRVFYGRARGEWLGETHREAIASEPQSTIADLLNRGLLRWWRQHDGKVGVLLAQVYDSMLIQCERRHAKLCADLVRRCLTEEIEVHGIRITIPVDVKIMESWAVKPEETM